MTTDFLHGVEVIDVDNLPRAIQTVRSSVIGLIGTAPEADVDQWPLDTPILMTNRRDSRLIGATGTLPVAIDMIYDNAPKGAVVILVRIDEGASEAEATVNLIGGINDTTGQYEGLQVLRAARSLVGYTPKILCAPGFTHQRSADGILQVSMIAGATAEKGTGYSDTAPPVVTVTDATGSGAKLRAVVTAGEVTSIVVDDPGDRYTAPVVTIAAPATGTQAVGGTVTLGVVRNRVTSELEAIAVALRAVVLNDGPNTKDSDAIQVADDFGSPRIYSHDPWYLIDGVAHPPSPAIAGIIAHSDNERGFWWSPSNREVRGIEGTSRHIDFELGDSTSRANLLNELKIATTIREDGFRLWGNRTLSSDQKYAFLSVVRTADMVAESIMRAHLWAVDRCITATYLEMVVEGVRAYLRSLQQRGAILGGDAWADADDNPASDITNGQVKIRYHFTPCYPAERVTFLAAITNEYIVNLFI